MIKCVIWDLDNTLLDGTYLEAPADPPAADPAMTAVLAELAGRGILQALASKNPPEAGPYAERAAGHKFAAAQWGWAGKPAAIRRIMNELDLAADSVAFVDDDPVERAEVSFALPDVLVLAPEDMREAAGWPHFSPAVITDEGRRRGELYLQRRARQQRERAFGGSREDFLRWCRTAVTISSAAEADLPRLAELSERTRQFNSAGGAISLASLDAALRSADTRVITITIADRFGDDGLVGGCLADTSSQVTWAIPLLMMSCRAMGRGVIDALLAWICQAARQAGAGSVAISCVLTARNVPLRVALTQAGFRTTTEPAPGEAAAYTRPLDGRLPPLPDWAAWRGPGMAARTGRADISAGLRRILARLSTAEAAAGLADATPLLRDGLGLDSLRGALLLTEVQRTFGVDVAAEDLNLDSLASFGALVSFVAAAIGAGD